MITGFNTDIEFNGRVYHVQTEDRGDRNPIIETLVYSAGEIITSRKTPYTDLVGGAADRDSAILALMEGQHKDLISEIRGGEFESGEAKPFGHGIVTNRSFDEVVLRFLHSEAPPEQIRLDMRGPTVLLEGARRTLELHVMEQSTDRPVCGAMVEVCFVATGSEPQALFSAATDESGRVEAAVEIPVHPGANGAIVCHADAFGHTAELRRLIKKER